MFCRLCVSNQGKGPEYRKYHLLLRDTRPITHDRKFGITKLEWGSVVRKRSSTALRFGSYFDFDKGMKVSNVWTASVDHAIRGELFVRPVSVSQLEY